MKNKPIIHVSEEESTQIKKKLFELLCQFDDFCKKNGLTYYLFAGNLIGAVRHKGFIPWDDDVDVCMPIEDYEKLMAMDPKSVSSDTFIQSYKSDPEFLSGFMKVRADNTVFKEYTSQHWNIHHGIYIDIFPMIGIPDDPKERKHFLKTIAQLSYRVADMWVSPHKGFKLFLSHLYHRFKAGRYFFLSPKKAAIKRIKFIEEYPYPNTKQIVADFLTANIVPNDRDDFGEPVYLEFEGRKFPCPHNWDHYLRDYYGDYMQLPPENERIGHHYIVELKL